MALYEVTIKARPAAVKEVLRIKCGGIETTRPIVFKNPVDKNIEFVFTTTAGARVLGVSGLKVELAGRRGDLGLAAYVPGIGILEVEIEQNIKEFFLFVNGEEMNETRLVLVE